MQLENTGLLLIGSQSFGMRVHEVLDLLQVPQYRHRSLSGFLYTTADSLSAHCGFLWITNRRVTDWQKTESTPIVYTGLIHSSCQYIFDSEVKRWARFRYRYVCLSGQAIQASKSINGDEQYRCPRSQTIARSARARTFYCSREQFRVNTFS